MSEAKKIAAAERLATHATAIEIAMKSGQPLTARDWAGFFSALASFAATVLPLIIELFAADATDTAI